MRWLLMIALSACASEAPVVESTNDTTCADLAITGCDSIRSCCSEEVIFRDGVEHERRFDGCWYEHDIEVFDCLGEDCASAEAAATEAACAQEA